MKIWFCVTMFLLLGNTVEIIGAAVKKDWLRIVECVCFSIFGILYWVREWPWGKL